MATSDDVRVRAQSYAASQLREAGVTPDARLVVSDVALMLTHAFTVGFGAGVEDASDRRTIRRR